MANYMKGFNRLDQKDALMDLENTVDDLHESAAANLRSMIGKVNRNLRKGSETGSSGGKNK